MSEQKLENGNSNPNSEQGTDVAVLDAQQDNQKTQESGALSVTAKGDSSKTLSLQRIGNRPVSASQLTVAHTFSAVGGERPIFASQLKVADNFYSSGIRPISASTLNVSDSYSSMGGSRPIASNEIDDSETLMGFID